MKKFALALISAAALIFGFGVVANAQVGPYGTEGTATTSDSTPAPGQTITMTLNGCTPPENVLFTLRGPDGNVLATITEPCVSASLSLGSVLGLLTQTPTGSATAELTLGTTPGTYTATAVGQTSGVSATLTFQVSADGSGGASLPATGSSGIGTTTQIAIGLLVAGLGLFGVAQFRRRQTSLA